MLQFGHLMVQFGQPMGHLEDMLNQQMGKDV